MSIPPILHMTSFGFHYGGPPAANHVADVRWMPNPFGQADYRDLSGLDQVVQDWLLRHPHVDRWIEDYLYIIAPSLRAAEDKCSRAVTVAIGCSGGHDRSVAVVEYIARILRETGMTVTVAHRDIHHRGGRKTTCGQ